MLLNIFGVVSHYNTNSASGRKLSQITSYLFPLLLYVAIAFFLLKGTLFGAGDN